MSAANRSTCGRQQFRRQAARTLRSRLRQSPGSHWHLQLSAGLIRAAVGNEAGFPCIIDRLSGL